MGGGGGGGVLTYTRYCKINDLKVFSDRHFLCLLLPAVITTLAQHQRLAIIK